MAKDKLTPAERYIALLDILREGPQTLRQLRNRYTHNDLSERTVLRDIAKLQDKILRSRGKERLIREEGMDGRKRYWVEPLEPDE